MLVQNVNEIRIARDSRKHRETAAKIAIEARTGTNRHPVEAFCGCRIRLLGLRTPGQKSYPTDLIEDELFDGESQRTDLVGVLVQDDYTNLGGHSWVVLVEG